jgi:CheY-like chemotaxis protein
MPGLLVVDDEDIVRQTILRVVESSGLDLYPIEEARTGQEAVTVAQHLRPSIILMDVRMPGMNGLEATRAIRVLPGCENLPIVALTANAFDEDRQRCLEAGMTDFMVKPVTPKVLYATVLRGLEQHARLQSHV